MAAGTWGGGNRMGMVPPGPVTKGLPPPARARARRLYLRAWRLSPAKRLPYRF